MNFLTPRTQLVRSGRRVVIHFPAAADAEQFMQCIRLLHSTPMVMQAAPPPKPRSRPESVWSLVFDRLRKGGA